MVDTSIWFWFAIIVVKQLFGILGSNFINPALAARAVLLASYKYYVYYCIPGADAVTGATPLAIMKFGGADATASATVAQAGSELPSLMDMFIGNIGGAIGETSALLY